MEKKPNAYRVIKKDLLSAYQIGDLSAISNLEGKFYIKENAVNTYNYDPTERYLHFFDSYENAKHYLKDVHYNDQDEYCICEFWFDEDFLKSNKFHGKYFSKIEMRDVLRDEYIFPAKYYSKENFLKQSSPDEHSKEVHYDPDSYGDYDFGGIYNK